MHTFLTRANALAAYTMSVLAGLTMVCFLSTFFLDYRTGSEINTVKVVVKHVPDYSASREKVFTIFSAQAFGHKLSKIPGITYNLPVNYILITIIEWFGLPNIRPQSRFDTTVQLECKTVVSVPYRRIWNTSQCSKPGCTMGQNHSKRRKRSSWLQVKAHSVAYCN